MVFAASSIQTKSPAGRIRHPQQNILEVVCADSGTLRHYKGGALLTQLTELMGRMQAGDSGARDALFAAAYAELHRLARARLREGARDVVLDTTCLVHESYLRFVSAGELRAEDRRAFFAYASQVMRSVIVNTARERIAQKRGGDRLALDLVDQDLGRRRRRRTRRF